MILRPLLNKYKCSSTRYFCCYLALVRSSSAFVLPPRSFVTPATRMSSSLKRAKLQDDAMDNSNSNNSSKTIGTHSGTFQADEAMGVWMLRQTPTYRNSKVIRSRDPQVLQGLDIVLDVGGVYDHEVLRYDHHQRDYDERFRPHQCTKLSAAGLIYRHYGKDVIRAHYPGLAQQESLLEWVYTRLYENLLEALDAIDTGVEPADELRYKDSTGLASRVGRLNPRWNEIDETTGQAPDPDQRFEQASALCGNDFVDVLTKMVESDLPARSFVEVALLARKETDPSGEILKFESGGMPWTHHLYDLEKEHAVDPVIKFVLYTDQAGMWRVQCVTVEGKQFENRLSLPQEWRGVRDEDLVSVTKIPGSRFCHAAGFIGGNDTYEGALAMAKEALTRKGEE